MMVSGVRIKYQRTPAGARRARRILRVIPLLHDPRQCTGRRTFDDIEQVLGWRTTVTKLEEREVRQVWQKGRVIPGMDPDEWREDTCGRYPGEIPHSTASLGLLPAVLDVFQRNRAAQHAEHPGAMYHFLFVPLTLGLSMILVIMKATWMMTGRPIWQQITRFWGVLFGINSAMDVATGITMEFQFGTNWAYYSHSVGDIFGAPLAIEGLMALFLDSTFVRREGELQALAVRRGVQPSTWQHSSRYWRTVPAAVYESSSLNTGYSAATASNADSGASLSTGICGRAPGATRR